jgi:hypothetical protein
MPLLSKVPAQDPLTVTTPRSIRALNDNIIMKKINAERNRNREFHVHAPHLEDEDVIADYICAYNKHFLRQGKMFLSILLNN